MCFGIKPVDVPPPVAASNTNAGDEMAATASGSASTFQSLAGASRKRPLNEESSTAATTTTSEPRDRKSMRYSACTCPQTTSSCDECDTQQHFCERPNKVVRFGGFNTIIPSKHCFSDDDVRRLWYGLDECAELNEDSKQCVRGYREQYFKDTLRHVLCVASQCSCSPPPLAYLHSVRLNLPDEARGLELGLLPLYVRQRRQEHVRKVVQVQDSIVSGKIPLKNEEPIKAKALAVQSMRSSQASQLFAQLLARNVAQDVRK
ncbi:hypothetical protein IV203_008827 [Nitzschia inconspicua]|uniref:Uncharacterized protein n=1 Tax=Nitzschia inconspicua TaxID=303405 RepID=A0A9K3L0B4_9STRA|nr:hypothetical protein IV203_008827 [Nitzschia inconspicua]